MAYDIVIRGGTVVDGTGLAAVPGRRGHQRRAHRHDRPHPRARAARRSTPTGTWSRPASSTATRTWTRRSSGIRSGTSSCWHGVTTVVMGHCGFTLAPAAPEQRHLVVRNLERAEDISGAAMAAGIDWTWTTFAEYLDAVDRLPKGINYAANIGHSALRTYAMGERAFTEEATRRGPRARWRASCATRCAPARIGFTTSRTHAPRDLRRPAGRLAARRVGRGAWRSSACMGDLGVGVFQLVEDPPDRTRRSRPSARSA